MSSWINQPKIMIEPQVGSQKHNIKSVGVVMAFVAVGVAHYLLPSG